MPAPRRVVVAVDGPSGSGKSSVSRAVALRLGLDYLDTGAMYRAVCWWCLEQGADLADTAAVARAATSMQLEIGTDPEDPWVRVAGIDVTAAIRTTRVSTEVSAVATNLEVRAFLAGLQRQLVESSEHGCVAEGRDITTVVAPDADVRVLLVADEQARLARRAREVHGSDDEGAVAATRDQVLRRDRDDSTVSQFLVAADGVVTLDSSGLTFDQTVQALLTLIEQRCGEVP